MLEQAEAYIPQDRRVAISQCQEMPRLVLGAVLFVDISGFTLLTNRLVQKFGARRGADELTRLLNAAYRALINEVDRFGGAVIGFSGDAITCWFLGEALPPAPLPAEENPLTPSVRRLPVESPGVQAALRASACALAMQEVMQPFRSLEVAGEIQVELAIKTAIASGATHRFLVGDPAIQYIDVLAGAPLERMATGDQLAQRGELVMDAATYACIKEQVALRGWRSAPITDEPYAVVEALCVTPEPPPPSIDAPTLSAEQTRPWVLPALYQRMQNTQSRFLAELRPATALFVKFAGLDFDHDADAGDKLDAYIGWVQQVVSRYEGALIQLTTGDKGSYFYVAFGAPIAHDDDSARAVAAALELRTPPDEFAFILSTQIGISQSMMRVGAYGSPTRRTYGVLGEATSLAARLMSHAKSGQILVTPAVVETVGAVYECLELGAVMLKGHSVAQPFWAVLGPKSPTGGRLSYLFTAPLVGRSHELAQMNRLLMQLLAGEGQILRIEGNVGVGKSHLVATFAQQAAAEGVDVLWATSQSTSQNIAYFAGRQLVGALLRLPEEQSGAEYLQIGQIESALAALNPAWLVRMPLLGDLLGLPIADNATTSSFDPRLRQEALITLTIEIAQARGRAKPLLLLFEDIHWLDETSQGMLLGLARVVTTAPLLVLLVQRPSGREEDRFLQELASLPNQTHLTLPELAGDGLAALVRHRLGGEIAPLLLALIQAQTQGNPFFAEELVDALRDANQLVQAGQQWTLAPTLVAALQSAGCLQQVQGEWMLAPDAPLAAVEMGIPSTVQGIVLARLDRLPDAAKFILKVASVIGNSFEYELLAQTQPLGELLSELSTQLDLLMAREFARLVSPAPHPRYLFRHNITQEVIYRTLLEEQRQELHWAVANSLERLHPEKVEDLAFHLTNCDVRQPLVRSRALQYLDAAGQRAKRDSANETALSYFNRALALEVRWPWLKAKIELLHLLGRRAEERETLTLLAAAPNVPPYTVALLQGEYYEAISEYPSAASAVELALTSSRTLGHREGEARCLARLGIIAWRQGDYDRAEQVYNQALQVIKADTGFQAEEGEVRYGLGLVYRQQGKYEEAQTQFEHDLNISRQLAIRQREARDLLALGHLENFRRNFNHAVDYYQQALEIQQTIGDRAGVATSMLSLAQGIGYLGDHSRAEPLLQEALQIYQAINDRWSTNLVYNELGILYFMVGKLESAKAILLEGLRLSREIGGESNQAYLLCNLGQVLRDQGDLRAAEETLRTGLLLAQNQRDLNLEAIYNSDLAMVCLQAQQYGQAIERAWLSLEQFRSLDLPLSTIANLGTLAQVYWKTGKPDQARTCMLDTLRLLDECQGIGPDFPQRDYWVCSQVALALGEGELAQAALQSAYRLLSTQAERISDPAMRQSYLEQVAFNRAIMAAAHADSLS
jgi:class 3 adenylate cyclase/tetratricopeptide (TPR) repeat protein